MSERQSPKTEIGGGVRDAVETEFNGVDGLDLGVSTGKCLST